MIDVDGTQISIDRRRSRESLVEFIKRAWHIVEPSQDYLHNWHIDMIAEHLEAITDGVMLDDEQYYNRLLINVPPGAMKSLITNVFWPSWEWGPRNMPSMRYVCASHSQDLAIRDSTKMRRLISSDWYQARWGDVVKLTGDQNQKTKFENTATGFRQAVAAGSITGARGDRVIIDDPLSVEGAKSEAIRKATVDWFLEAVPTRLNNPDQSAIVVIMQRLHEDDPSGVILDKELGYDHIMIPMEYDPDRAAPTMLGTEDPREDAGELFFPARFPEHVVERDKKVMGSYEVSGQFQQMPTPKGGEILKEDWWQLWDHDKYPRFDFILASCDTAYTEKKENDYSACTIWGVFSEDPTAEVTKDPVTGVYIREYKQPHPKLMLIYAFQMKATINALVERIYEVCNRYKVEKLLIEAKATGISVEQEIRRIYASKNFSVQLINPGAQDKVARVYSIQHLFEDGMVYAPNKDWANMVIRQCASFPKGKNDDLVDTVSQALRFLRTSGMLQRPEEIEDEVTEMKRHTGAPPPPLYNV